MYLGQKEKWQFWGLCPVTLERAGLGLIIPDQIFLFCKCIYSGAKQITLLFYKSKRFNMETWNFICCESFLFLKYALFPSREELSFSGCARPHSSPFWGERGEEESCWNLILWSPWFVKLSFCSGNREIWKTPHFPAATAGHQASEGLTQILNILSVSVHFGEFSLGKGRGAGMWMCCSCGELGKQAGCFPGEGNKTPCSPQPWRRNSWNIPDSRSFPRIHWKAGAQGSCEGLNHDPTA